MTDQLSAGIEPTTSAAPDAAPGAAPNDFREMMRGFPTGVAIVTATDLDGRPWGMTCSSMCSVTLTPPTMLVCMREGSPTLAAIGMRGAFAVNLLHAGAQAAAELFASGDPHRFDRVAWQIEAGAGGPHLHEDSLAIADCRVGRTLPTGDHTIVFGEVVNVEQTLGRSPLLYGLRRYGEWSYS